jgi:hypothetical protein
MIKSFPGTEFRTVAASRQSAANFALKKMAALCRAAATPKVVGILAKVSACWTLSEGCSGKFDSSG